MKKVIPVCAVGNGLAGELALFPVGFGVVVAAHQDVVAAVGKVVGDASVTHGCNKKWNCKLNLQHNCSMYFTNLYFGYSS